MKKTAIIAIVLFIAITFISCANEPVTAPEIATNCTYPISNDDFNWRIDTVADYPSTAGGIWAFSDSDAYLMGYIVKNMGDSCLLYCGLHWNGKEWSTDINGEPMDVKHYANDVTGDDRYMVSVGYWAIGEDKAGLGMFDNKTKKWDSYQFQTDGELYSVWTDGKGYFIAGGSNGMIYIKDGYTSDWVYVKAPTEITIAKITGISKNEIYMLGGEHFANGKSYRQIWRYSDKNWTKLMDDQDSTGMSIKIPEAEKYIYGLGAYRCPVSDSLYLYAVGSESYKLTSKGNSLVFNWLNLSEKCLPFSTIHEPACRVYVYSPNDYWVTGARYQIYHWNGKYYRKIMPSSSFKYGNLWGTTQPILQSKTGKTWMLIETDPQIYVLAQGTPK